ncbi:MAG: PTS sugar transporter subunit IIA [Kiritimatiellae bacterium]|nr:PTS sugar transporter subunit IIA [Kiritimatiellia bacterium]
MVTSKDIRLADYLDESCVLCNLETASRDEILARMVAALKRHVGNFEQESVLKAVIEREVQSHTVLASGLALPHARIASISQPMMAVAISPKGIDFEAPGEDPVNVIVLILTPKFDPGSYLRLMTSLSKLLNNKPVIKRLCVATSAREVYGIITESAEFVTVKLNVASVMDRHPVILDESNTLSDAIHAFCAYRVMDIPIVDSEGDLRGVIAIEDLLRQSLPDHLLWMEDLSPIANFEPFAELLREDEETKIADFMHDKYVSIHPETPAIQLAKMFLMEKTRQIQVVEGRKFIGVVNLQSFNAQVFWA